MANIKTSKAKEGPVKCVVIPRTNDAIRERFVKVNGKTVPFDREVYLTENDIKTIQGMKEPMKVEKDVNVHEIMEKMQIPQSEANRIAEARMRNGGESSFSWVPKFSVVRK